MTASFVVYIDESGDEGFIEGATEWFVLSAVITKKETDLPTVKLVDQVRAVLGRKAEDREPFHFRKLKHEQRLPFLQHVAQADLKTVTVFVHKPTIVQVERFRERNRLYFYTTRLLLERVSWYCRDHKTQHIVGDGSADIVFSNRSSMSYADLRTYFDQLKLKSQYDDIQIDWNIIKSDQISAFAAKGMGLQIADAVASGFFFAVQRRYGFTEDRYARLLKPTVYVEKGRYSGYGLKFWPREYEMRLKQESHLSWLSDHYNF